ncbi:MAG: biotin/lipoyl-containing protein, partial [Candidatus Methylomirabilales bacterium]
TIARWIKKPGDAVAADEPLVELETDKVTVEVPAPAAGVLQAILAKEGDEVFTYERMKETVTAELKKLFNPELLNRIDEVIVFHPLNREHMRKIVDIMLSRVQEELKEKRITLQVEESAKEFLVEKGYNPNYGARPLRRAIQRYLEDPLAEEFLKGMITEGSTVRVKAGEGALLFEAEQLQSVK